MKYISLLLSACLMSLCLELRAQTARQCFLQMPDSLCPLLTEVNRADCIDFLDSGMKAQVSNRFGGKSEMTRLTDDYIALQLTELTSWQMKLLPLPKGGKLICTVFTACAPACDSQVQFYTTDWKSLPSSGFLPQHPSVNDFLSAPADTLLLPDYQAIRRQSDYPLMKAELSPEQPQLIWTFTTPEFLSADVAERLRPYLQPTRIWQWTEGCFTPHP